MSEIPEYVEKLCRLCLSHPDGGEMVNIFEKPSPNEQIIANRIFECVAIKIHPVRGAPFAICELCRERLDDWFAFREQCAGSDQYLKGFYKAALEAMRNEGIRKRVATKPIEQGAPKVVILDSNNRPVPQAIHKADVSSPIIIASGASSPHTSSPQLQLALTSQTPMPQLQKLPIEKMEPRTPTPKLSMYGDDDDDDGSSPSKLDFTTITVERPHQCAVCKKCFKRRDHLKRHVLTHKEYFEHVDNVSIDTLMINNRNNPNPPTGFAPTVPFDFFEKSDERPHQCELCQKCFKRGDHLRRHKQTHREYSSEASSSINQIDRDYMELQEYMSTEYGSIKNEPVTIDDDAEDATSNQEEKTNSNANDENHSESSRQSADMPKIRVTDMFKILANPMNAENQMPQNNVVRVVAPPPQYYPPAPPLHGSVPNYYPEPAQNFNYQQYEQRPVREKFVKVPGDRPYQCQTCMKCFKRSDHLRSHERTHTGDMPWKCDVCFKSFRYRQNWNIHRKNTPCGKQSANPIEDDDQDPSVPGVEVILDEPEQNYPEMEQSQQYSEVQQHPAYAQNYGATPVQHFADVQQNYAEVIY